VTIYRALIGAFWLLFIAVWVAAAFGAKQSLGSRARWRERVLPFVAIALFVLALRTPVISHALRHARAYIVNTDPHLGVAGVVLCALGIGLAIWARIYLGRNWGLPMTRKEHPELITSGPYAYVRHPIYSGIMLAMLGSAIAETFVWLVPLALVGVYFIYSARAEERLMAQEFPQAYSAYRKRTKMLVPFLL
jgi:protein-S-isoprenylcysteine O-methyltransferase Ste14